MVGDYKGCSDVVCIPLSCYYTIFPGSGGCLENCLIQVVLIIASSVQMPF